MAAVQNAWDNLDPGLKQWLINGAAFAISFIPIAGPLISCIIDGTFVDMWNAIQRGDWAMLALSCAAFVPGMKQAKMGLKAIGKSERLLGKMDDLVKVRHYTNAKGKELIEGSGFLKKGSYVTSPSEIAHGMNSRQIEKALEISPGKGEYYIDLTVSRSKLSIPSSGPLTSGGVSQWQITEDIPLGSSGFKSWLPW